MDELAGMIGKPVRVIMTRIDGKPMVWVDGLLAEVIPGAGVKLWMRSANGGPLMLMEYAGFDVEPLP